VTTSLSQLSDSIADLVRTAGSSVVRVEARRRLPASGIVFSADGLIVTANHVVEHDEQIHVGLPDGQRVAADLVGRDPHTDLALLKVEATGLAAALWQPADSLSVGHVVLALGRPGQSVQATLGIVSAHGAAWRTAAGGDIDSYLQTDVAMYPGFSGGPLATAGGDFAGLNSSALVRGVSVTIPGATVGRVVSTLLTHGRVPRAYLGIGIQPVRLADGISRDIDQETALMVMSVEDGSPAAAAGILQGDIIVALDGGPVRQVDDLQAILAGNRVGREVSARVVRSGRLQDMAVTLGTAR
jgi:S1-C subfamily serine protease